MYCEGKLKLRSHNTSYCLIEVVTGLTVPYDHDHDDPHYLSYNRWATGCTAIRTIIRI